MANDVEHLFLLNPAYCGSTAFAKLLLTSPCIGAASRTAEGQWIPAVRGYMEVNRWRPETAMPWDVIAAEWMSAFRRMHPQATVFFDKSPPNLMRAGTIETAFPGARFIVWMREPYAWAASMKRRKWPDAGDEAFAEITRDWIERAERQVDNARNLQHVMRLDYEAFAADPEAAMRAVRAFMPSIGKPNVRALVKVKDYAPAPISDHNNAQRATLSEGACRTIRETLCLRPDLVEVFGYSNRGY